MLLSEVAACVDGSRLVTCGGEANVTSLSFDVCIKGLTADSRFCAKGSLFFCLTGGKIDSHVYACDAEESGAAAIVCERELPVSIPQIVVPDSRKAMSLIAAKFYGNPAERLKIIGITGTNGKTTTSHMLASILRRAGKKVAIVGTLGIYYGQKEIAPELTTPDPIFLHKTFADMLQSGVEYVVAEISAHAAFYYKDEGIRYTACIFTNLTQDHLDFFADMNAYKAAKKRLFNTEKCPIAVLNGDDSTGREIGEEREKSDLKGETRTVYYGLDTPSDAFAVITSDELRSCGFMLNLSDKLRRIALPVSGKFNVYNALAAAACADALGIRIEAIAGGLNGMKPVRGRLEHAARFRGADIFVDFAHTPDGLEKTLETLKAHCKGKLFCLFGCGGDRDKSKRPIMGETVARKADFSILTSDNPRYEDPTDIIAEIERGYRRFSVRYAVIPEREKAIFYAVGLLQKGDVLLVAGKGGEEYQEIMGIKYPYNDNDVIKEAVSRDPSL